MYKFNKKKLNGKYLETQIKDNIKRKLYRKGFV